VTSPSDSASPRRPSFAQRVSPHVGARRRNPGGTSSGLPSLSHARTRLAKLSLNDRYERQRACRTRSAPAISHEALRRRGNPQLPTGRPGTAGRARLRPRATASIAPERCPLIGRCMAARPRMDVVGGQKKPPNAAAADGSSMRCAGEIFATPLHLLRPHERNPFVAPSLSKLLPRRSLSSLHCVGDHDPRYGGAARRACLRTAARSQTYRCHPVQPECRSGSSTYEHVGTFRW